MAALRGICLALLGLSAALGLSGPFILDAAAQQPAPAAASRPAPGTSPPAAPAPGPVPAPAAGPTPAAVPPPATEPPPFKVELAPRQLKIGQVTTLAITFSHAGTLTFRLPEGASFGKLELLGRDHRYERDDQGQVRGETFLFRLAGYESGEMSIPPLPFDFVDAQGREHRIEIPGNSVRLRSLLENEQEQALKPARPPLPVEVEDLTLLYVAGVAAALLIGGALALLLLRFWRRRPTAAPAVPPRPAEEVARERLAALEGGSLLAEGKIKEFYLELSGIVRDYLERRFATDATAMTSSELVEALYDRQGRPRLAPPGRDPAGMSPEQRRAWAMLRHVRRAELEAFFDEADMVQFARYMPAAQEIITGFAQARGLVERTTPAPEETLPAPARPAHGSAAAPPTAPAAPATPAAMAAPTAPAAPAPGPAAPAPTEAAATATTPAPPTVSTPPAADDDEEPQR